MDKCMYLIPFFLALLAANSLSMSLNAQDRYSIFIEQMFSLNSDVTVVLTSCARLPQLSFTLNSFFHFNTCQLRQFIIIEDCDPNQESKIWGILPERAQAFPQFFKVLVNTERKGQMGAIDIAYSIVKTKYVYHLEDDWLQLGTYGIIERMKDVLEHAQSQGIKVSQIVTTFLHWSWTHMPTQLNVTPHGSNYFKLKSYGKDWLYSFSFNPHLINIERVYRGIVKGSLIQNIGLRYHCIKNQSSLFLEDGGCIERYLGHHLTGKGYDQIFIDISQELIYKHIGTKQFAANPRDAQNLDLELSAIDWKNSENQQGERPNDREKYYFYDALLFILLVIVTICLVLKGKQSHRFEEIPDSRETELETSSFV